MVKLLVGILVSVLSLPLLAATKIKVGVSPALSSAGIYIAQENGYFKDAGFDVELLVMNSSTSQMTGLLSNNEIQIAAGNLTAGLYAAWAAGSKFRIVADKGHVSDDGQYIWLIVREDLVKSGKVKSPKDLKGLKIGLPSVDGSSQQVVLDRILKSEGLSIKDVETLKVGYPEMNIALSGKSIDAAVQLEPFVSNAVKDGVAVKFASAHKYHPNQQSAALLFSEGFSKQNNKIEAIKFMKAYLKGVQDYNESLKKKELWIDLASKLNKYTKIDGEKFWKKVEPVGLSSDGKMNIDSMKGDMDWYVQNGFLKTPVDISSIVDLSFLR